jgi:hypothetical protein
MAGPAAFAEDSSEAAMARAAVLLHVGSQMMRDPSAERTASVGRGERFLLGDDFFVPRVVPTGERFRVRAPRAAKLEPGMLRERTAAIRAESGSEFFQAPSPATAARLAQISLTDPDELTRVAAATVHFHTDPNPNSSIQTLAQGTRSEDELVREVAATALARIAPRHPAMSRMMRPTRRNDAGKAGETTLLVHGTFARSSPWWQPPTGDFHVFLSGIRPDLYGASDRFEWSGGYSERRRSEAALQLKRWVDRHNDDGLDLVTHSHGGNVAFLATGNGLSIGEIVLLSCPVHARYVPIFDQISKAVSVRVKWDLVILADGGGQKFENARITENILPVWFNHSATHTPSVWTKYDIQSKI